MTQRQMSRSNPGSFQQWMEEQRKEAAGISDGNNNDTDNLSIFKQLYNIQENFTNQLQELSGSLPDAGPLSAAFRQRATHAIYLLLASITFALLAIFIGLPTLIFRPSKFVICMTLSTLCAASSVIVLQKPSVFFSTVLKGDLNSTGPVIALLLSLIATIYVTIVIHKYIHVIIFGGLQIFCLLYYLSSFIPGGTNGLMVLLKTGYFIIGTILKPFIYICQKSLEAGIRRVMS